MDMITVYYALATDGPPQKIGADGRCPERGGVVSRDRAQAEAALAAYLSRGPRRDRWGNALGPRSGRVDQVLAHADIFI